MAKKLALLILGSLLLTLLISTMAWAWTPEDIYNDFAQNGKLTRNYTDAELRAYLNDATIPQYPDAVIKARLDTLVTSLLTRSTFPFTGFQIAMGVLVVVVLIGGGVTLRLLTRPRRKGSQES
jgi:hypothetical protein